MGLSPEDKKRLFGKLKEGSERSRRFGDVLTNETPRGCALVAGAFLEQQLLILLQARMINRAAANKFDFFFEGVGPLGSFAARTHLSCLLGFISKSVYQDLCVIREIRNRFAHSSENMDFDDSGIKTDCAKLYHYMKRRVDIPRAQFIGAVSGVDLVLEYLIFDSQHSTTPEDGPEEISQELRRQYDMYQAKIGIFPPVEPPL